MYSGTIINSSQILNEYSNKFLLSEFNSIEQDNSNLSEQIILFGNKNRLNLSEEDISSMVEHLLKSSQRELRYKF